MSARWLWAVGALICAQLVVPRVERVPKPAGRELKRSAPPRPAAAARLARQD